jgi:hypothetical protein
LIHLDFIVRDYAELLSMVDVVVSLLPHGFRHLEVVVYRNRPWMRLSALMHLARLQGLPELLLHVDVATAYLMVADASLTDTAIVLSGLSGIRYVQIVGLKSEHIDALDEAYGALEERGLPFPTTLALSKGP